MASRNRGGSRIQGEFLVGICMQKLIARIVLPFFSLFARIVLPFFSLFARIVLPFYGMQALVAGLIFMVLTLLLFEPSFCSHIK